MTPSSSALVTTRSLLFPTATPEGAGTPDAAEHWEQVVRLASAHLVLPALAAGLERQAVTAAEASGAGDFLRNTAAANIARNRELRDLLATIAAILSPLDEPPLVLKGALVLAGSPVAETAWRFLGDLDLMLPMTAITPATARLADAGFHVLSGDYDPGRDAHTPGLLSPCRQYKIELHSRLFADPAAPRLQDLIWAYSRTVRLDGHWIRCPAAADRIAHLIAHAQLHHRFHAEKRLLLRDVLEFDRLMSASASSLPEAIAAFDGPTEHEAAVAFVAAADVLTGTRRLPLSACARKWADQAIARLADGGTRRQLGRLIDVGRAELVRHVAHPGLVVRQLRSLGQPGAVGRKIARRAAKLRQSAWS